MLITAWVVTVISFSMSTFRKSHGVFSSIPLSCALQSFFYFTCTFRLGNWEYFDTRGDLNVQRGGAERSFSPECQVFVCERVVWCRNKREKKSPVWINLVLCFVFFQQSKRTWHTRNSDFRSGKFRDELVCNAVEVTLFESNCIEKWISLADLF